MNEKRSRSSKSSSGRGKRKTGGDRSSTNEEPIEAGIEGAAISTKNKNDSGNGETRAQDTPAKITVPLLQLEPRTKSVEISDDKPMVRFLKYVVKIMIDILQSLNTAVPCKRCGLPVKRGKAVVRPDGYYDPACAKQVVRLVVSLYIDYFMF